MGGIRRKGRRDAALVTAVAFAFVLSACATGALKKEGFTRPPSATAVVLMDPDIELSEFSAGGLQQPKAEWSEAAEKLMTAALEEHFGKKSLALQRYQEPADAQARAAHERVVNLHRAVGLAIRAHKYPNLPSTLPTKEKSFDWTLGEGGATVWGQQQPASARLAMGGLPLGLAHEVRLLCDVKEGQLLSWSDVAIDQNDPAVRFRREMEAAFARPNMQAAE